MEGTKIPEKTRVVGGSGKGTVKVYISKTIYQEIFTFSKDKNICECGGILLGNAILDGQEKIFIIKAFIEAKNSEGTSNSITFTKDTWNYIDKEKEKYPEYEIVGWMHTNPDTGCRATEYDVFFQTHMFGGKEIIAYIVDPVQIVEAFYFLEEGELKQTDGFYIFMEEKESRRRGLSGKKKTIEGPLDEAPAQSQTDQLVRDGAESMVQTTELNSVIDDAGEKERRTAQKEPVSGQVDDGQKASGATEAAMAGNSSVKMKILVSLLAVWIVVLTIGIAIMAVRISQLEKYIDGVYQNRMSQEYEHIGQIQSPADNFFPDRG